MDAKLVCICILILSGSFTLMCLGLLLLRASLAVKETTVLLSLLEPTIEKANRILDDVDNKLDMLNAPVELVSGIFSSGGLKAGMLSMLGFLTSRIRRKK